MENRKQTSQIVYIGISRIYLVETLTQDNLLGEHGEDWYQLYLQIYR